MPMIQLNLAPQPESGTSWVSGELVAEPLTQADIGWTDGTNRAIWPYTASYNPGNGHFENNGVRIRVPGTDTGVSAEGPQMKLSFRMVNNLGEVKYLALQGIVQANAATPGEWNVRTALQGVALNYVSAPGPTVGALTASDLGSTVAPLASPLFTGDPRGPTPPATDNDTTLATTAYVKSQSNIAGGFPGLDITARMSMAQLPAALSTYYGIGNGVVFKLGEYAFAERMADALGLTPTQAQKNKALEGVHFQNGIQNKYAVTFSRAGSAWLGTLTFGTNAPRILGAETGSPAILIERPSTNLVATPRFTGTNYSAQNITHTAWAADDMSPTGGWAKVTCTAGNTSHYWTHTVTGLTDGGRHTFSIRVKPINHTRVRFYVIQGGSFGGIYNLVGEGEASTYITANGATTDKARIKAHPDGSYTLSITGQLPAGVVTASAVLMLGDPNFNNTTWTAAGTEAIWWDLLQAEALEIHTSPIPTGGGSRVAENYNANSMANLMSLRLGRPATIAFAAYAPAAGIPVGQGGTGYTQRIVNCTGGGSVNWGARFYAGTYVCSGRTDGGQTWSAGSSLGEQVWVRTFIVWDGSQVRVYVNGSLVTTSAALTSDTTITVVDLGQDTGGGNALCGLVCPGADPLGIPLVQGRALSAADVALLDAQWAQELSRIHVPY